MTLSSKPAPLSRAFAPSVQSQRPRHPQFCRRLIPPVPSAPLRAHLFAFRSCGRGDHRSRRAITKGHSFAERLCPKEYDRLAEPPGPFLTRITSARNGFGGLNVRATSPVPGCSPIPHPLHDLFQARSLAIHQDAGSEDFGRRPHCDRDRDKHYDNAEGDLCRRWHL